MFDLEICHNYASELCEALERPCSVYPIMGVVIDRTVNGNNHVADVIIARSVQDLTRQLKRGDRTIRSTVDRRFKEPTVG